MTTAYEEFESLIDFRGEYGFANIVPLKHVALTLFLSQATIKNKIRQGEAQSGLKGVKIENDYFVFAKSLKNALKKERKYHRQTVSYLLESLEQGNTALNYSDGMELIGLDHTISSDRTKYAKILRRISEASHEICGCLITVIVHSKNKGVPSGGFFGLAEWINEDEGREVYDLSDDVAFTEAQTARVLKNLDTLKEKLADTMKSKFGL